MRLGSDHLETNHKISVANDATHTDVRRADGCKVFILVGISREKLPENDDVLSPKPL